MKFHITAILEQGDALLVYAGDDETARVLRFRKPEKADVTLAGKYNAKTDSQRIWFTTRYHSQRFVADVRIEDKASAGGYDTIPVLALWAEEG